MEFTGQSSVDALVEQFGITCFATSDKTENQHAARNILMWSHYGMSHTGLCFQFHIPSAPETFVYAVPVAYKDEFITINWVHRDTVEDLLGSAILRKALPWHYKHERRIVMPSLANTLLEFRPTGLKGIILGSNASSRTALRVVAHCRRRLANGDPAVRLYRAELTRSSPLSERSAGR